MNDVTEPGPSEAAVARPPLSQECPFPGLASYDHDRRKWFRGREVEAPSLAAAILGRRLSVLTAGSGDGKTSLIHAALLPLMLSEGIEVAVAEPGGKAPLQEIGGLCLSRLTPVPDVQCRIIDRLSARYGADATLKSARALCQKLPTPDRQRLLDGQEAVRPLNCLEGGPLVSWLRDPGVPDQYLEAAAQAILGDSGAKWPGPDAALTVLRELFAGVTAAEPIQLARDPDAAREQLVTAMGTAIRRRRQTDDDFEIVLFLDQFEETFVRFRQAMASQDDAGDEPWRQRDSLLEFVREILRRPWPLRLVLSLRKEHYADLQSALSGVQAVEANTYHLGPLGIEQARNSLMQPAEWPGKKPTSEQATVILNALAVEGRIVYPALLSVVGEWLWEHPDWTERPDEELEHIVPEAIDNFVRRAFSPSERRPHVWSAAELCEAMDVLDQLIIRSGTMRRREAVAAATLINQPLRRSDLRERVLVLMEIGRLLRRETRLGEPYVEVVHEAMIDPCLAFSGEVRANEPDLADLPRLIDDLRTEARESFPAISPLRPWQAQVLVANIDRLELPPMLAARTLTRLMMFPNLQDMDTATDGSQAASPGGLRPWREVLRKLGEAGGREDGADEYDAQARMTEGRFVSPAAADLLWDRPGVLSNRRLIELIAGSALAHRDPGAQDRIRRVFRALRGGEAA